MKGVLRIWVLLTGLLLVVATAVYAADEHAPVRETYDKGVVLEIIEIPSSTTPVRKTDAASGLDLPVNIGDVQKVRLRIDSGRLAGQEFTVDNILGDNPAFNVPVRVGSRVIVSVDTLPDGSDQVYLADRERSHVISAVFALFMILLVWVGGRKPVSHFAIAAGVLLLLINGLAPAMLVWKGTAVLAALLALFYVMAAGYFLLYPRCRVPYGVFVFSTYSCVMLLMFVMLAVAWLATLQGFFNEGVASLWFSTPRFDYEGLLHACTMLMGVGFVFYLACGMHGDVSDMISDDLDMAVLKERLLQSGRERLGPMLAIQWLSMSGVWLPLLVQTMDMDLMKLFNMESVATVMANVVVTSFSLVASVPLLAWLVPQLLMADRKKRLTSLSH